MELNLRPERPADHRHAEELIRDAFWDVYVPGAVEHYLLHIMRAHPDFVPELTFVAEAEGRLVGHIAYAKAAIEGAGGVRRTVLGFGPVGVRPDCQGRGVGEALIRTTLSLAAQMDFPAVVITGDPRYYHRVGFRCGEKWDITCEDGRYSPALMAYPLHPGALDGLSGRFYETESFRAYHEGDFAAFDATFPPKEKGFRESQKDFAFLSTLRY